MPLFFYSLLKKSDPVKKNRTPQGCFLFFFLFCSSGFFSSQGFLFTVYHPQLRNLCYRVFCVIVAIKAIYVKVLCVFLFIFLSFWGNLAPCGTLIKLRAAKWRKINAKAVVLL